MVVLNSYLRLSECFHPLFDLNILKMVTSRAATIQLSDNTIRIAIFASRYDTYRDTLFGLRRNFEIKQSIQLGANNA